MSTEESSKNNWVIDAYDPLMRLEYEDGPVPHGTSLIIKHGLTGQVSFIIIIVHIIWTISYGPYDMAYIVSAIYGPYKNFGLSVFVPKKRLSVLHLAWRKM